MKIPALILKRLYNFGSLENVRGGARFVIKNRLSDVKLQRITQVSLDGKEHDLAQVTLDFGDEDVLPASEISPEAPRDFDLGKILKVTVPGKKKLDLGKHEIRLNMKIIKLYTLRQI